MTTTALTKASNMSGILYMIVAIFMLSAMDAVAKWLVEADISVFQILFVRGCINVLLLFAAAPFFGGYGQLRTSRPGAHSVRALFGFLAPFLFFTALISMPLAETTVVFFISPFVMTALSVPLFKEKVGIHRWGAILAGFGGVLYVAQPTSEVFNPAVLFVIGGSLSYCFLMLSSRWLGKSESTISIMFYGNLGAVVCSSFFMPFVWKAITFEDLLGIGAMALLSLAGNVCILKAFMRGEVGVITPFEYSGLAWAVIFGMVFFNEIPSFNVWVGIAVIAASGIYIVYRENIKRPEHV